MDLTSLSKLANLAFRTRRWQRHRLNRTKAIGYRLQLETLEDRTVLDTVNWTNPAGGNWNVPGNWNVGHVPAASDDVIIDIPLTGPVVINVPVTVASAATMTVGSNVRVQIAAGQTLSVAGAANLASGSIVTLSSGFGSTQRLVVDGTLTAIGSTLTLDASGYQANTQLIVNGTLTASGSTFSQTGGSFAAVTISHAGDLSANRFDLPLYVPAALVPQLAGGTTANRRFQDINILSSTISSGSLDLNAIGSESTANLRYVFPGGFTIAAGAALNVAAGVKVLLQPGQTLSVAGAANLASGSIVTLSSGFGSTQRLVVDGTLTAIGSTLT
ncbi:MAG TPA: hypothetical protein VKU02_21945, partial [Gemmataceae bacterium]|nr:hypothetical protein [Gemmataceae bacterium]